MKRLSFIFLCCFTFLFCTLAAAQQKQNKPQTGPSTNAQALPPSRTAEGEKLFRVNCGRCHNPPESLSPREVRAVVRHMRVRAVLTDEQERAIVKFLAP
jgi:mono/diheme cytochrome c family protein